MKMEIKIQFGNLIKCFGFLNYGDFSELFIRDEFVIYCYKHHNHSFSFRGFFYKSRRIYCFSNFRSKRELYCAVQELLKEELYHVVQ